jgi:hypothetical protein
MDAGISFSPAQNQPTGQAGGGMSKPGATPLQDAIKLLSFKLPTNVGAGAPSPSQIMGGPTALGAQLGNGVANDWLMALFRGLNPAASGGAVPTAGTEAMHGMGSLGAPSPFGQPPTDMAAGSSLPGAMGPPRPAVQFPAAPVQDMPPTPTWGDMGGARRTMGPAASVQTFAPQMDTPQFGS